MTPALTAPPMLVIGAGAWGTALAIHVARRARPGTVTLWARNAAQALDMQQSRENRRYLPGCPLPQGLVISADLDEACAAWRRHAAGHHSLNPQSPASGLLVMATPLSGLEQAARMLCTRLGTAGPGEGLIWLTKGLRRDPIAEPIADPIAGAAARSADRAQSHATDHAGLQWPHQIVAAACTGWRSAALTGPSFAQEVARGLPVALTAASLDLTWARAVAQSCHGGGMRIYASDDLAGAELGGAMKNVLAIAAGVCDGLSLGANARAALLTRGLAEMARLGMALGARPQTFMGLATLGDLILTATGDLSRNRRVGLALAAGQSLQEVVAGLGHVAEGVSTAPALAALAQRLGVDVPITEAVCGLLAAEHSPREAMARLMARDPRDEYGN